MILLIRYDRLGNIIANEKGSLVDIFIQGEQEKEEFFEDFLIPEEEQAHISKGYILEFETLSVDIWGCYLECFGGDTV